MSTTFMDIYMKSAREGMDICVTCSSVCEEVQLELVAEDTTTVLRRLLQDIDLDSCLKILRPNKKLSLCETCHETLKNASLFRNKALKSLRELENEWCCNQLQQNTQSASAVENTLTNESIDIKVELEPYQAEEMNPPGALQFAALSHKTTESYELPSFDEAYIKTEYDSDDYVLSEFHSVSSESKIVPKEEMIETDPLGCEENIASILLGKGSMNLGWGSEKLRVFSGNSPGSKDDLGLGSEKLRVFSGNSPGSKDDLGLGSEKLRVFSGNSQGSKEDGRDIVDLNLIVPIFDTSHCIQALKSNPAKKITVMEKNKSTRIKLVKIIEKTRPGRDQTTILSETESECESDRGETNGAPIRGRQRIRARDADLVKKSINQEINIDSTSTSHSNSGAPKRKFSTCFVPMCPSNSTKFPNKLFLNGPLQPKLRKRWFQAARREYDDLAPKSGYKCCEDHFDLENDVENWVKYKLVGGRLYLKKNVVPKFFECQNKMKPSKLKKKR